MYEDKISIIVPIYNVELYLRRCLDSILNQTYSNLEIILVDDGSTDKSGKICDEYAKNDSRIKVIHKNNGGLSDARNEGLKIARGKYVGFVDSDDWIELDMYECLYDMLQKFDADISICGANSVDNKKREFNTGKEIQCIKGYKDITIFEDSQIMKAHLHFKNEINSGVWNKLYKREIVDGIEFPVAKLYEDVFTMYKYLDRATRVVKTRAHKYNYFQRKDSICRQTFSIRNFDSIEGNRVRYFFVKKNYPKLEPLARKRVLIELLNIAFRLSKNNQEYEFLNYLKFAINATKKLSINGCELNNKQRFGIFLLRNNIWLFFQIVKKVYR